MDNDERIEWHTVGWGTTLVFIPNLGRVDQRFWNGRPSHGLITEVANATGLSRDTVKKWSSRKPLTQLSGAVVQKWSRYYGCEAELLYDVSSISNAAMEPRPVLPMDHLWEWDDASASDTIPEKRG